MKTRTGVALLAIGVGIGGFGGSRLSTDNHNDIVDTAKLQNERPLNIEQKRYSALLNGRLKVLGGLTTQTSPHVPNNTPKDKEPRSLPNNARPNKVAREIINSVGSYILELQQDKLPSEIKLQKTDERRNRESIVATMESESERMKCSVKLSILLDVNKEPGKEQFVEAGTTTRCTYTKNNGRVVTSQTNAMAFNDQEGPFWILRAEGDNNPNIRGGLSVSNIDQRLSIDDQVQVAHMIQDETANNLGIADLVLDDLRG